MTRHILSLVLLLAIVQPAFAEDAPFWQKTWTVSAIEGSDNDRAALGKLVGKQIVIGQDQLTDPVHENCSTGVSYGDIKLRPVNALGAHFGDFWAWPNFPDSKVTFGWIRCTGSNVGGFAFVDSQKAYLFYENGIVIDLK